MKRGIALFFVLGIFLLVGVSAEISHCCEKLAESETYCVNAPESECDSNLKSVPTACESTSYCQMGCCYNTQEGTCSKNTPASLCDATQGGVWEASATCDIPQGQLGCCLIGDQTAFTTETRCNKLSALYGLEIEYRPEIISELECIANAGQDVRGACVYDINFATTCEMTTKGNCQDMEAEEGKENVNFYEGYLCSNPELGTECAPSDKTTCVDGKDEIYFLDTCGNLANIYDAEEKNDIEYWKEIIDKSESCNPETSNADHPGCGNCNYFLGSTCREYQRGQDQAPLIGDYICRDLSCEYKGKDREGEDYELRLMHGESICAPAPGTQDIQVGEDGYLIDGYRPNPDKPSEWMFDESKEENVVLLDNAKTGVSEGKNVLNTRGPDTDSENLPGSRYYRLLCYNGELITEPCADFRQEICVEAHTPVAEVGLESESLEKVQGGDRISEIYYSAACRPNRWQDCAEQTRNQDCQDISKRDCYWIGANNIDKCAPIFPPGLDFWSEGSDASGVCSQANDVCTTTYERGNIESDDKNPFSGLFKFNMDRNIKRGEDCEGENVEGGEGKSGTGEWLLYSKYYTTLLGDCGSAKNYLGYAGASRFQEVEVDKTDWN